MVFVAASNIQAAYDNKLVATVFTETKKKEEKTKERRESARKNLTKAAPY